MTIHTILIILLTICAICILIILADSNRFVVKEYTLYSDKIARNCTFVILADLHNKKYGPNNEKLATQIEAMQPDGVVIAGDMVTSSVGSDRTATEALLERLAKRFPIYYANGNHEYKLKVNKEKFGTAYEDYMKKLAKAGIEPLVNACVVLPQYRMNICGLELERRFFRRFQKEDMPDEWMYNAVGKADKDNFQILIAHNPEYFPEYAKWGADLVISGHVHGGMARLPILGGVISPAFRLFPKYDGGLFKEKESVMILSRGLGMHTIPIRFYNPGELVVLHLSNEK
ncbi:MAG: metallophosphoesterase [Lachnospiraceae bacterium]|nr:metallophosphoesterase [Lachnospiraceae bacterium]